MIELFYLPLLFLATMGIATVAVMAGVGGGVLFTPLMLAFTGLDVNFVRSAGLALAMTDSVVGGRRYLKAGATRLNLVLFGSVALAVGSSIGAVVGVGVVKWFGTTGEAAIRIALGVLIMFVVYVMWKFGRRREGETGGVGSEWGHRLGLYGVFYDPALKKEVKYHARNVGYGFLAFFGIGMISGMFGVGGGWAIVPTLFLIMGLPLKVSVGSSVASFVVGDMPGFWIYVNEGAVAPTLLAAVMMGPLIGATIGSKLALRVKTRVIRYAVLTVMAIAAINLIVRGLQQLGVI
ncbi:MAG: sulfite exporter TauE/SafE family protein [Pyrobaculum sp.]